MRFSAGPGNFDLTRIADRGLVLPYGLAVIYFGLGLALRAAMDSVAPGVDYFVILLPVVVLAGATCGPWPAALAATMTGLQLAWLVQDSSRYMMLPPRTQLADLLLFLAASLAIVWMTAMLRRAILKSREAEARLAEVFRQIPGAAAIISAPDGKLLMRSTRSDQVLGHGQAKIESIADLGRYSAVSMDGRVYAAEDFPISRALKHGETVSAERLIFRNPMRVDGVALDVYSGPVRDAQGRIVAAVGMAFDVSEKAAVERQLAESECRYRVLSQRLQAALDAGALGLWEFDAATGQHRWDSRTATMFGLPPERLSFGWDEIERFLCPGILPQFMSMMADACAARPPTPAATEWQGITSKGETLWFVLRTVIPAEAGPIVGVIRDVTDERQREQALRDALHAREVLFREADHRIKNSLQLVVSLLNLQRRRLTAPDAAQALIDAVARVNAVADAHLALQQSPDLRSIALDSMLHDLCARLGKLDPAIDIVCRTPPALVLDAEQAIPLGLLVSELLTNALRHAFAGRSSGSIAVTVRQEETWLILVVADDGVGLGPNASQSGLGTTIIKSLAMRLDATVSTASPSGQGVAVTVRFGMRTRPPESLN